MRDGRIDRNAFFAEIGGVIRDAGRTGRPVRAYGEMVALLWDAGDVLAAIDLETLWNELSGELPFSLYCAYHSESVAAQEHAEALHEVCRLHSAVVPTPVEVVEVRRTFPLRRLRPPKRAAWWPTPSGAGGMTQLLVADAELRSDRACGERDRPRAHAVSRLGPSVSGRWCGSRCTTAPPRPCPPWSSAMRRV